MLRAFGVYLERAETFRKALKTFCSTRCLSEWIRWCTNFYFVLANMVLCEGRDFAFWAVVQVISCFSTSVGGICGAAIPNSAHLCSSVDLVHRFDSCYVRTVLYFLFKLFSLLVLLQTPATRNMQRQQWSMVGCSDPSKLYHSACSCSSFTLLFFLSLAPLDWQELWGCRTQIALPTPAPGLRALKEHWVPVGTTVPEAC